MNEAKVKWNEVKCSIGNEGASLYGNVLWGVLSDESEGLGYKSV